MNCVCVFLYSFVYFELLYYPIDIVCIDASTHRFFTVFVCFSLMFGTV